MHAARELLRSLELPTLRDAVLASVVANLLDYGAPNLRESLSVGDFTNLDRLPLWVDDFGRMVDALGRARRLVWKPTTAAKCSSTWWCSSDCARSIRRAPSRWWARAAPC